MRVSTLIVVACLALLPVAFAHIQREHKKGMIDSSNIDTAFAAQNAQVQWTQFKAKHNKVYETTELEQYRFELFQANLVTAAQLQKRNPEATFSVTKFMDLHPAEFKRTYLNYKPAVGDSALLRRNATALRAPRGAVPAAYDWRTPDQGRPVAVTAVKDQGQCGSCWAFSATEEVESAYILAGNAPVNLAPEQTVDCDTKDSGCNGGDTVSAYAYMETVGVMAEKDYPYTAGGSGNAGTCQFKAADVVTKVTGFNYATPGCTDACTNQDEGTLKNNLYNVAPVSICVDAQPWQFYTSGILMPSSGCESAYDQLDHCVQLVGYGSDGSQAFWNIRNSWNTDWGEVGYIRISYGTNTCGVADEATIATVPQ